MYVEGAGRAADFYKQVFGATELMREFDPDGTTVNHAQLKIGDTMIMLSDPTSQDVARVVRKDRIARRIRTAVRRCICMFMLECGRGLQTRSRSRRESLDPVEDKEWATDAENRDPFGHVLVGCDAAQRADAKVGGFRRKTMANKVDAIPNGPRAITPSSQSRCGQGNRVLQAGVWRGRDHALDRAGRKNPACGSSHRGTPILSAMSHPRSTASSRRQLAVSAWGLH